MVKRKSNKMKTIKGRGNGASFPMHNDDDDETMEDYDAVCHHIMNGMIARYNISIQHNTNMTNDQYYAIYGGGHQEFIDFFFQSLRSLHILSHSHQAVQNHLTNYYHWFRVHNQTLFTRIRFLIHAYMNIVMPMN